MTNLMRPADWSDDVSDIQNSAGNPLFKKVELNWRKPTIWEKGTNKPEFDESGAFLYALVRNHGNSSQKDKIEYIGLTRSPKTRFGNHETAREIVAKRGEVKFTYAPIEITRGKNSIVKLKSALEELEHLLIWAVPDDLWNDKKVFTLPGMGSNGGSAWHIKNTGYRFSGRMPREIIYPWMLVVHGRDRTMK
jgi:hypothetical protein